MRMRSIKKITATYAERMKQRQYRNQRVIRVTRRIRANLNLKYNNALQQRINRYGGQLVSLYLRILTIYRSADRLRLKTLPQTLMQAR